MNSILEMLGVSVPKMIKKRLANHSLKAHGETVSQACTSRLAIVLSFPNASDGSFSRITRWIDLADQVSCLSGYSKSPLPVPKTSR